MKSKKIKIGKRDVVLIAIALIMGLALGSIFFGSTKTVTIDEHDHSAEASADQTIWTCSMHPQIKKDAPGDCPICGMDLIPLETIDNGEEADPNEIQMTKSAMKLAEVQTFIVKEGAPEKSVYLLGKVKADERNVSVLTARFGGRIEKLYINYTGQHVKKGQKLASIYSPNLITAQRELLEAAKYKDTNPSFYDATRSKLKLWDLSEEQIKSIENSGEPSVYFDILSPITGTVTRRDIAIGDYVKEGNPLFEVVDLSRVWIMFDAYESDLPWIKKGDKIDFTIQSLPGKTYSAKVTYIDPFINASTRVAQVRVEMRNSGLKFKPEMFVNGILQSNIAKNTNQLLIPKTSILWTGKRAVVYVKVPNRESPSFIYREIVLGPETGNFYVVSQGLHEGEEIVTNGVFKIDASAQLAGKPSMMNPSGGAGSTPHDMSKMGTDGSSSEMTDEEMEAMEKSEKKPVSLSKETPAEFKKQLGNVVTAYLKMKDGFVATDETKVEKEAKTVLAELEKVDMGLLKGDAHIQWMKLLKPIKDNLNGIVAMKEIEMKRSHFVILSDALTKAIDMFGTETGKPIYLEFCPMANNDKGAFWISADKEIKNPYYGEQMMTCGEVKRKF